jgi:hypothetical protein
MTEDQTVSSEVEVAVDPDTAFAAFTEELDLWWVRGPINHFAGGRAMAVRCEPGVGGRLLEVYEDDALELGRITTWEPGKRLAWRSSVDDVNIDVSFAPAGGGCLGPGGGQRPGRRPGPRRDGVGAGNAEVVRAVVRPARQRPARGA